MAAGDCAAALTDAEKAIELKPKLAYSYVVRALCRADSEDLGAAWEDANTAIELGGPDFVAYYTRGYVAAEKGDRLNAKLDFGEAIDLAPSEEMVEEVRSLAEEYDIPLD
jgi:Flp pilus assembly protein TadD